MSPNNIDGIEYYPIHYVAYGSSLNIASMTSMCPDALLLSLDRLYGFKLAFCGPEDGESFLTLKKDEHSSVPVAVWKISVRDKEILDRVEELGRLHEIMKFFWHHSTCFTYIMLPCFPACRPSRDYLELVEKGYQDMGFDLLDLMSARY